MAAKPPPPTSHWNAMTNPPGSKSPGIVPPAGNRQSRTHLEVRVVPGTGAPSSPGIAPQPEPQAPPPPSQPKGTACLKLLKQMYRDWRTAGGTPDIFALTAPPGVTPTPIP